MSNIIVSVIVPIYNVEDYVVECLKSLIGQSLQNIEIICVDDCSTDGSMEHVQKFAAIDARVTIVSHRVNRGLSAARNTGMAAAKGKYISFVDSDDLLPKHALERQLFFMEQYDVDCVWSDARQFGDKTELMRCVRGEWEASCVLETTPDLAIHSLETAWGKLFRRSSLADMGLLFPEGLLHEDVEFHFKFLSSSKKITIIHEPLYLYRIRGSSIMRQKPLKTRFDSLFKIFDRCHTFLIEKDIWVTNKEVFFNYFEAKFRTLFFDPSVKGYAIASFKEKLPQIESFDYYKERHPFWALCLTSSYYSQRPFFYGLLNKIIRFVPQKKWRRYLRLWFKINFE